jgi:dihydrofolate reductase
LKHPADKRPYPSLRCSPGISPGCAPRFKHVVSSIRNDFSWANSHVTGDLRTGVQELKDATPAGVLLGSGKLANELDRLGLIDEYRFLVHPRIAGHGPTLYESGLPSTRRLELVATTLLHSGAVAVHYRRVR